MSCPRLRNELVAQLGLEPRDFQASADYDQASRRDQLLALVSHCFPGLAPPGEISCL